MTAADDFTRASPHYANAQRLGARAGSPIEVPPVSYWAILLEAAGLGLFFGAVLASFVGGAVLMGWL